MSVQTRPKKKDRVRWESGTELMLVTIFDSLNSAVIAHGPLVPFKDMAFRESRDGYNVWDVDSSVGEPILSVDEGGGSTGAGCNSCSSSGGCGLVE